MDNTQKSTQANQGTTQAEEAYTIVNGKRIPLSQAQAAEQAREEQVTKTGIQQAHDNSTEPVQSGKTASQQTMQQTQQQTIKQSNVQSGQAELEQHMNQTTQAANTEQQNIQATQAAEAKTKAAGAAKGKTL
jgi:hypothetical protein